MTHIICYPNHKNNPQSKIRRKRGILKWYS